MIARLYHLRCDGCRRSSLLGNSDRATHSTAEARSAAQKRGWQRVPRQARSTHGDSFPGADYCPACVATNPEIRGEILKARSVFRRAGGGK